MTTATATRDRTATIARIHRLREEEAALSAPLQRDLEGALNEHAEAVKQVETAVNAVASARGAVAAVSQRIGRERGHLEHALRDTAPASISEFREWCLARVEYLTRVSVKEVPDREQRVIAAHAAIQEVPALALLGDEELEQCIAELRAAIEATGNATPAPADMAEAVP